MVRVFPWMRLMAVLIKPETVVPSSTESSYFSTLSLLSKKTQHLGWLLATLMRLIWDVGVLDIKYIL